MKRRTQYCRHGTYACTWSRATRLAVRRHDHSTAPGGQAAVGRSTQQSAFATRSDGSFPSRRPTMQFGNQRKLAAPSGRWQCIRNRRLRRFCTYLILVRPRCWIQFIPVFISRRDRVILQGNEPIRLHNVIHLSTARTTNFK